MWVGMEIPGGTLLVSELNWCDMAQAMCQVCVCVHVCNDVCTCFDTVCVRNCLQRQAYVFMSAWACVHACASICLSF